MNPPLIYLTTVGDALCTILIHKAPPTDKTRNYFKVQIVKARFLKRIGFKFKLLRSRILSKKDLNFNYRIFFQEKTVR